MKVICIHFPHTDGTVAQAIYETKWEWVPPNMFMTLLDELHDVVRESFSLELYCAEGTIYLCVAGSDTLVDFLAAWFPIIIGQIDCREVSDYTLEITDDDYLLGTTLRQTGRDVLPIQDFRSFSFSTLSPAVSILSKLPLSDRMLIQIIVRPAPDSFLLHFGLRCQRIMERLSRLTQPRMWFKRELNLKSFDLMKDKSNRRLYDMEFRIVGWSPGAKKDSKLLSQAKTRMESNFKQFIGAEKFVNTVNENAFRETRFVSGSRVLALVRNRKLLRPRKISTQELSALWHPCGLGVVPNTARAMSCRLSPPPVVPTDSKDPQISFFGQTNFRGCFQPFGIRRVDRRRHFHLLGKSGTGKSSLMKLLIKADIDQGYGCAVLDPRGDLVDDVLRMIPKHRVKDVVLLDPTDTQFPVSFNPLSAVRPELRYRSVIMFIGILKQIFGGDWSTQADQLVRYALYVLVSIPGATLLSMRRLLIDPHYRSAALEYVEEQHVRDFWEIEYQAQGGDGQEAVSRILARLDHLLGSEVVLNMICQPENLFDFRKFMDSRKILLLKLPKGMLGNDVASLLGSLIVAKIYEAALSRADTPLGQRKDFYLYVDEFQNFATDTFSEILSESRKYRLSLTFAHQFLGQLPSGFQTIIFGNVGNILSFRVGTEDAGPLASEFRPKVQSVDLINLGPREFYVKMSVDGEVQETFSGATLDTAGLGDQSNFVKEAVSHSRSHYALPLDRALEVISASEIQPISNESAASIK